jgi:threonine/homoserine/homoserine lactone efflux protein
MLESVMVGAGFAFAAAAQPGPLQAFLLARVAAAGWRRTLPAAAAPLISDGPIALLALVLLRTLAQGLVSALRVAGGVVLLLFAIRSYQAWRQSRQGIGLEAPSAPRTLLAAVGVNVVNPGPYLGWTLVLGPLAIESWAEAPAKAVALVLSFYVVVVLCLVLFILAVGTTSILGPRFRRALLLASSVALASLGLYSLYAAFA